MIKDKSPTLQDAISKYYDAGRGRFVTNVKCVDSEGRIYAPIDMDGDSFMNVDVGGTERKLPLKEHLTDKVHSLN